MGKEKILPAFAMIILLVGIISSLYVYAQDTELERYGQKDIVTINNIEYSLESLFKKIERRTIIIDEKEITGIALDKIIINANVNCPSCHKYTIKASDDYQQTVNWDMMKTGIITDYNRVIFPNTAHSFWVRDVIEIEVK